MTSNSSDSDIVDYLVKNHGHLRQHVASIANAYHEMIQKQPREFHDAIRQEALGMIQEKITVELAKSLPVSPLDAILILERTNLGIYL